MHPVAYVVDPIRQTRNFFQWRDGRMEQVGGFWINAERGDRVRLARLVNDLENINETPESSAISGAQGTSITPRLEAQLIAMLSRQNTAHSSSVRFVDNQQTALLYGMLGAIAGILGLGLILWLNQLSSAVYQQSQNLIELERNTRESADRQRLLLDTALNDEATGRSADKFLQQYNRADKEREDLRKQLADRTAINDTLGEQSRKLTEEITALKAEQTKLKAAADNATDAADLRDRVTQLEKLKTEQAEKLVDYEKKLDTVEGRKSVELHESYAWAWYSAAAGWGVSIILGVTLAVGYFLLRYQEPPPEAEPFNPSSTPPVHIN